MELRPGVRLALDWGDARIGVAACDRDGVLAYPLTTVQAGDNEIAELAELIVEHRPIEVLVGLPRSLRGTDGPAALRMRQRAAQLAAAVQLPVRLVDERLTTVAAAERLRAAGKRTREQRGSIDAAAATLILEHALALERAKGSPPGELVSPGGRG
jgi:putative Holliday junction resolvase